MMSKARTTVSRRRRRSAGIRRIVPKSAGSVTPSAVDSRWTRTLGASDVVRSGIWTPSGSSPIDCSSVSAAWTSGNTSMVT